MSNSSHKIDLIERYNYAAAVMNEALEDFLKKETYEIKIPKGILYEAQGLFATALASQDPNAKYHPGEALAAYNLALSMAQKADRKEYKTLEEANTRIKELKTLTDKLEKGKVEIEQKSSYEPLRKFFELIEKKADSYAMGRFYEGMTSEFTYTL